MVRGKSLLAVEMEELLILIALILLSLLIVSFTQLMIKSKTIDRIETRLFTIRKATYQLGILKTPITYKGYTFPLLTFLIIDKDVVYNNKYSPRYLSDISQNCLKKCRDAGSDICMFLDDSCSPASITSRRLGPFFLSSPIFSYALKIRLPDKNGRIIEDYLYEVYNK